MGRTVKKNLNKLNTKIHITKKRMAKER